LLAVPALALIVLGRRHLVDESRDAAPAGRPVTTLEILKVGPVWMCFAFFFLLTMAFGAFQNFGAPLMQGLYDMSVAGAAATLSTYLLGGAAGILAGGFLARSARQDAVIACALGRPRWRCCCWPAAGCRPLPWSA
jgi:predicted MFS family arabinose efflux permease